MKKTIILSMAMLSLSVWAHTVSPAKNTLQSKLGSAIHRCNMKEVLHLIDLGADITTLTHLSNGEPVLKSLISGLKWNIYCYAETRGGGPYGDHISEFLPEIIKMGLPVSLDGLNEAFEFDLYRSFKKPNYTIDPREYPEYFKTYFTILPAFKKIQDSSSKAINFGAKDCRPYLLYEFIEDAKSWTQKEKFILATSNSKFRKDHKDCEVSAKTIVHAFTE